MRWDVAYCDYFQHEGVLEKSGRYPWGSGDRPYQRLEKSSNFLKTAEQLKSEGLSEKEISDYFGMTVREYRSNLSIASSAQRAANQAQALKLKNEGWSNSAIANRMGVNESTVRSWLNADSQARTTKQQAITDSLQDAVDTKKYIDIGAGAEQWIGCTRTMLENVVQKLKNLGYKVYTFFVPQVANPGQMTKMQVLAGPDSTYQEVLEHQSEIALPGFSYDEDDSEIRLIQDPVSVSSDRIDVVYGDEGGSEKDGVIELRRGVDDISLGDASYAQVRIAVDGTHYLKGMAVYSDDLPDGIDIRFNTNKKSGTPVLGEGDNSVLKSMKDDMDNPFGATVRQTTYIDSETGEQKLSAINIVNEEGDWSTWSNHLASQFLSKQYTSTIKQQLDLTYSQQEAEYEEIMGLENNVVKAQLLESFADDCDSKAVTLQAAALPRQSTKVILPLTTLKSNEVYAPTYNNGDVVALVRYPHAGTFEIPVLQVNNSNQEGQEIMGTTPQDAIGISAETAQKLSGADFDGDFVLVIPTDVNTSTKIKATSSLGTLQNFDPKTAYPAYEGMTEVGSAESGFNKQLEMGKVSNLITDMTIKGASESEIARAVKHSMVVIDAEKHNLNYKQSYIDNGIKALADEYQDGGGASTLISKASSEVRVPGVRTTGYYVDPDTGKRTYGVNPNTGEKVYTTKTETYTNKAGKTVEKTTKSTAMAETKDARTLSSGTVVEEIYANYANNLKSLANQARKSMVEADEAGIEYSSEARKTYADAVESLTEKLNNAIANKPLERKAQILANAKVNTVLESNPSLKSDTDSLKKLKQRALAQARKTTGAKSRKERNIQITDYEWEAISNGAISKTKLEQIIDNADTDRLRELSMPSSWEGISPAKESRIKAMLRNGYTQAEIASALGVSVSTVSNISAEM